MGKSFRRADSARGGKWGTYARYLDWGDGLESRRRPLRKLIHIRSAIPKGFYNPSRWLTLSEVEWGYHRIGGKRPIPRRGSTEVVPLRGSDLCGHFPVVSSRQAETQPPARIVASLRLCAKKRGFSQRSPEGRMRPIGPIKRPYGTRPISASYPAINRRATLSHSYGMIFGAKMFLQVSGIIGYVIFKIVRK